MWEKREVSLLINEQWEQQVKSWKKIQKFQNGDMSLREWNLLHLYEM